MSIVQSLVNEKSRIKGVQYAKTMGVESGGTAIITSELTDDGVRISTVHTVPRRVGFEKIKKEFEKTYGFTTYEHSQVFDEHGWLQISFSLVDIDADCGLIRITGTRLFRAEKIEGIGSLLLGLGGHIKQDVFHTISPEIKDIACSDAEAIAEAISFFKRKADDISDR